VLVGESSSVRSVQIIMHCMGKTGAARTRLWVLPPPRSGLLTGHMPHGRRLILVSTHHCSLAVRYVVVVYVLTTHQQRKKMAIKVHLADRIEILDPRKRTIVTIESYYRSRCRERNHCIEYYVLTNQQGYRALSVSILKL
jgi:hypothetical protein